MILDIVETIFFSLIALGFLFLVYLSMARKSWAAKDYMGILRAFLFLCFVWVFGAVIMHLLEFRFNHFFSSVLESFWSIATYLLSGFEDRGPNTGPGRAAAVLIMIGGVSVVAYLTGELAAFLTAKRMQRRHVLKEGEYLIVNWSLKGDRLVKELNAYHRDAGKKEPEIMVIHNGNVKTEVYHQQDEYKRVTFVAGDAFDKGFLRSVRAHNAARVIILADENDLDSDGANALVTLGIRALANEEGTHPYIIVEALNHRKSGHIKDAGADEVICFTDYQMGLLAQTSISPRMSEVYLDLLTVGHTGAEDCEIYMVTDMKPDSWKRFFEGKSFAETARQFLEHDPPAILIGLKRGDGVMLNPKPSDFSTWEQGDAPIFVAYGRPEI
ncbi:MAG: NAD-binding protein [candidate division WOR-3 bacterium]